MRMGLAEPEPARASSNNYVVSELSEAKLEEHKFPLFHSQAQVKKQFGSENSSVLAQSNRLFYENVLNLPQTRCLLDTAFTFTTDVRNLNKTRSGTSSSAIDAKASESAVVITCYRTVEYVGRECTSWEQFNWFHFI